jgi:hypothetical protein
MCGCRRPTPATSMTCAQCDCPSVDCSKPLCLGAEGFVSTPWRCVCCFVPQPCSSLRPQLPAARSWKSGRLLQTPCSRRSTGSGGYKDCFDRNSTGCQLLAVLAGPPAQCALADKTPPSTHTSSLPLGLQLGLHPAGNSCLTCPQLALQQSSRQQHRRPQRHWPTAKLQQHRRQHHVSGDTVLACSGQQPNPNPSGGVFELRATAAAIAAAVTAAPCVGRVQLRRSSPPRSLSAWLPSCEWSGQRRVQWQHRTNCWT